MNAAVLIVAVFILLLIASAVAVSYVQSRRAIENFRSIERERMSR